MIDPSDAPLVSVVTPAYKAQDFIEETMRSVWAQDYRPLEHVIVDDCSPDATGELAREAASRPNGRWVQRPRCQSLAERGDRDSAEHRDL